MTDYTSYIIYETSHHWAETVKMRASMCKKTNLRQSLFAASRPVTDCVLPSGLKDKSEQLLLFHTPSDSLIMRVYFPLPISNPPDAELESTQYRFVRYVGIENGMQPDVLSAICLGIRDISR